MTCSRGSKRKAAREQRLRFGELIADLAACDQAVARALVPDGMQTAIPAELEQAADNLVAVLKPLLDPCMDEWDAHGPVDGPYLRLGISCALLRLVRGHDAIVSPDTYVSLALTMQV